MLIKKFLTPVTAFFWHKRAETKRYDEIFAGEASSSALMGSGGNFLSGLRSEQKDVDAYFKDVFAGPVF